MSSNLLMVFVKNPILGRVKTRLAKSLGHKRALSIYKQLLSHTRLVVKPLDVDVQVWYDSHLPENDYWDSDEISHDKKLQLGHNLGERIKNAFQTAFDGGYKRVVIIGSDNADISSDIVNQAFTALDNKDAVIGPAEDGGYYLLGINQMQEQLFTDIPWSTEQVFQRTVDELEHQGNDYEQLETLRDIDTADDWLQFLSGRPRFPKRYAKAL